MNKSSLMILLVFLMPYLPAWAQTLSQKAAVALAEKFVAENGYTNVSPTQIKQQLDLESIERTDSRTALLEQRHNTLQPKAIGVKKGRKGRKAGWSIAFDPTSSVPGGKNRCRVVTMDEEGSGIRVEHVDGICSYFAGFNQPVNSGVRPNE